MSFELSLSWPNGKVNVEDEVLDVPGLWPQLIKLSNHVHQLEIQTGDEAPLNLIEMMEAISDRSIDPEKDWNSQLDSLTQCSSRTQQRYQHLLAAIRQECYFHVLFNSNYTVELQRLSSSERQRILLLLHAKLESCIAWGYRHYSIALGIYQKQKEGRKKRASHAGQVGADYRKELEIFLRLLVRGQLKKHPEEICNLSYDTAKYIASVLEPLLDVLGVEITERGDDLIYRIDLMIRDDPELKRLHEKT